MHDHIARYFAKLQDAMNAVSPSEIAQIGDVLFRAYRNEKQVFVIGNGGSSSTASHMAADLAKNTIEAHMRRFRISSLNDNSALMTALANDLGYEHVFAEQLKNLVRAGDVLIAISASGNSPNVLNAMQFCRGEYAEVIALLGFDGGEARALSDHAVVIPSQDYGVIEDMHLILNHVLVEYFKERLDEAREFVA